MNNQILSGINSVAPTSDLAKLLYSEIFKLGLYFLRDLVAFANHSTKSRYSAVVREPKNICHNSCCNKYSGNLSISP
jgi:hypothetical protein